MFFGVKNKNKDVPDENCSAVFSFVHFKDTRLSLKSHLQFNPPHTTEHNTATKNNVKWFSWD